MFKRSFRSRDASAPLDAHRVDKYARLVKKGPGGGSAREKKLQRSFATAEDRAQGSSPSLAPSPIVTLMVGAEGRLFAAHEDVLCQSPFFGGLLQRTPQDAQLGKRISLPDEEPEVFSAVLEYLYKGDYYPRLLQHPGSSKHRSSWYLEDSLPSGGHRTTPQHSPALGSASPRSGSTPRTPAPTSVEATVWLGSLGDYVLRDTVIYCAADRYGLEELKSLALRKQGLQSGIDVATILRSAQYAYAHTPDSDSRLRAHYLALIIRCRKTFKRSGTMQAEIEGTNPGGKLFFDLFVAMCNHLDDVIDASNARTPKTV